MNDFYDCATCGHSIHTHTVKRWPSWVKFCTQCDCKTGYNPNWKNGGKR